MFCVTMQKEYLETALKLLSTTVGDNSKGFSDDCISMVPDSTMTKLIMYTTDTVNFTKCEAIIGLCNSTDPAPLVNFNRLKKIISTIPKCEMVTLEEKNNSLIIKYKLNSGVSLVATGGSFLQLPTFNNTAISIDTEFLRKCTIDADSIIDYDVANGIYNCLKIKTSNMLDIEASAIDSKGSRAYMNTFKSSVSNPDEEILIEANALKKVFNIFNGYTETLITQNGSFVKIYPDETTLIPDLGADHQANYISGIECYRRVINGVPFNTNKAFNVGVLEYTEVSTEELIGTLSRVKSIEDSFVGNRSVEISIRDKVNIKYSSPYGEISEDTIISKSLANAITGTYVNSMLLDVLTDASTKENIRIGELNNHPGFLVINNHDDSLIMISPVQTQQTNP